MLVVMVRLDDGLVGRPTPAVVLRGGTHYIAASLVFTHRHSDLHMLGYVLLSDV